MPSSAPRSHELIADPDYPLVWSNLDTIARSDGKALERHVDIIPIQFLLLSMDISSYDEKMFDDLSPETVPAWREYVRSKMLWRESKFKSQFPNAGFYRATFQEELDCLEKLVGKWTSMKEENPSLRNQNLDFLRQVSVDGQLGAFIFLELFTEEYRSATKPGRPIWKALQTTSRMLFVLRQPVQSPVSERHWASGQESWHSSPFRFEAQLSPSVKNIIRSSMAPSVRAKRRRPRREASAWGSAHAGRD